MPEHHRRAKATAAANKYAPRPEGSAFTYGVIAVVLAILTIVVIGMFYGLEVFAFPVLLCGGLAVVFVLGVLLQRHRQQLHRQAFDHEFSDEDSTPPAE